MSHAVLLAPGNVPGKKALEEHEIFSVIENRADSENISVLMNASSMPIKIRFMSILRCEGKYLSLKARVLKAVVSSLFAALISACLIDFLIIFC